MRAESSAVRLVMTLIIAALILVLLIFIVGDRIRIWNTGLQNCQSIHPEAYCNDRCEIDEVTHSDTDCKNREDDLVKCCVPLIGHE